MLFNVKTKHHKTGEELELTYDNQSNILTRKSDGFVYAFDEKTSSEPMTKYKSFSKDNPLTKSKDIKRLRIQLGLSCNYSCEYCSQRSVDRPPNTSKKDIDTFMEGLDKNNLIAYSNGETRIEYWGGEPFVYWKTLKPLHEAILKRAEERGEKVSFFMSTNGALIDEEISQWIIENKIYIGLSHDGPGQHVRGPDPLENPKTKEFVLDIYKNHKLLSFNPTLSSTNYSRKEIYDWFVNLTGDPNVILPQGDIVDVYDEGSVNNSPLSRKEQFDFRKTAFDDLFNNGSMGFIHINEKIDYFTRGVLEQYNSDFVTTKCGMHDEHTITVDLNGNVTTCFAVTAIEVAPNGQPHLSGHITDVENVKITSSTHWTNREHCKDCPVLHICRGACMFLDGKLWDITCSNSYSNNIPLFAIGIAKITRGFVPYFIESPTLPDYRKDIWGDILEHKESRHHKVIPIQIAKSK
jgi:uncharacterized protein